MDERLCIRRKRGACENERAPVMGFEVRERRIHETERFHVEAWGWQAAGAECQSDGASDVPEPARCDGLRVIRVRTRQRGRRFGCIKPEHVLGPAPDAALIREGAG